MKQYFFKKMNKILFINLLKLFYLTIKNLFKSKMVLEFSERSESIKFRGLPALLRHSNSEEKCIGCKLCVIACPVAAINLEFKIMPDYSRSVNIYEIDLFKCIYCGLCESSCPENAIIQTNLQNYHFKFRGEQILTKEKLLAIGDYYQSKG